MAVRVEKNPISVEVGARIRALREALDLNSEAFAAAVGHPNGTQSKIERAMGNPKLTTLDAIARKLGVELLDLFLKPEEMLRHRLIEATRELSPGDLQSLLDHARRLRPEPPAKVPYTLVPAPRHESDPPTCVELIKIEVAAGAFTPAPDSREADWVEPHTRRKLAKGYFVCRVVCRSMEPKIPGGAYVLFSRPPRGDLRGKIILARLKGVTDDDTSASYTVKRFECDMGANGQQTNVRFEPENPAFRTIAIDPTRGDEYEAVAELIEVLSPRSGRRAHPLR